LSQVATAVRLQASYGPGIY